jgi:hypothetical protein
MLELVQHRIDLLILARVLDIDARYPSKERLPRLVSYLEQSTTIPASFARSVVRATFPQGGRTARANGQRIGPTHGADVR